MQWRMVGRRGRGATWTIVGDLAQSSWPVPGGVGRRARGRARRQAAPRLPPLDQLPQLLGDLRLRGGLRRAGGPRRRPARRGPLDRGLPGGAAGSTTSSRRSAPRLPSWPGRWRARSGSWCRPRASARSAAGSSSWPEFAAETGSPDSRLVVLTGLDTKGLEFDGIVVVAAPGDRGRVPDRPRHPLRRLHPRHPADDHPHLLVRRPGSSGSLSTATGRFWSLLQAAQQVPARGGVHRTVPFGERRRSGGGARGRRVAAVRPAVATVRRLGHPDRRETWRELVVGEVVGAAPLVVGPFQAPRRRS